MSEDSWYISHSEVTNYNQCSRQWIYAHLLDLRPVKISDALAYGTYGHEILEKYYTAVLNDADFTEATGEAFKHLKSLDLDVKMEMVLQTHMLKYFVKYINPPWRLVAVEKAFKVDIPNKPYGYGCKLDLVVEITEGRYRGKLAIIDHKFTFNFWGPKKLKLYPQLPRYIWATRETGLDIDLGILAQIRYRTFKDYSKAELFAHEFIEPNAARIENSIQEFFDTADIIYEQRQLTVKEALANSRRTLSSLVCDWCDFSDPCNESFEGRSEQLLLASNYKKSDYGYNK